MGQSSSRQERGSIERPQRPRSTITRPTSVLSWPTSDASPTSRHRPHSTFFGNLSARTVQQGEGEQESASQPDRRRRSRLFHSNTSLGTTLPSLLRRHATASRRQAEPDVDILLPTEDDPQHSRLTQSSSSPPQLEIPSFDFDQALDIPSLRRARPLSDSEQGWPHAEEGSQLGGDHGVASTTTHWRMRPPTPNITDTSPMLSWRRRSPLRRNEDTSAMLTRLLSAAAAATAMSLTGVDAGTSINSLPSGGQGIDGDDGSFNGFLESLSSGRLATTLSQGQGAINDNPGEDTPARPASLEFFRMFRFGSSNIERRRGRSSSRPSSSRADATISNTDQVSEARESDRMVPVLIVGIRALTERDASQQRADGMPSFLDSLTSGPTAINLGGSDEETEADMEPPLPDRRSRRRSTIGGFNFFSADRESARQQDQSRPATSQATPSDSPFGPHPPPTTPASPGLSAMSSGNSTPTRRSSLSSTVEVSGYQSRRSSLYRRLTGVPLEPTLEEQQSSQDQAQPRPRGLRRRPRIHSWSDGPRHDTRRNGVLMEPSSETPSESSSTRSWIIYILGGNYPENHPILTTPSLFTDNPSYEDMLVLSNLLGTVKPPVANAEDVAAAGGIYKVHLEDGGLAAHAMEGEQRIGISSTDQCLVCLSGYQEDEEIRRLVSCNHEFHRECIDQWLTTGRNSCPLCRTQGVDEKLRPTDSDAPPQEPSVAAS